MNAEEGYQRAKMNLAGRVIIMGATECKEEWIKPLIGRELRKLPFQSNWWLYQLVKELGFQPSYWALQFGRVATDWGHNVSKEEWCWLHGPATLIDAKKWLKDIQEAALNE